MLKTYMPLLSLLMAIGAALPANAQSHKTLALITTKAHLFEKEQKPFDLVHLVSGAMEYKENIPGMLDGYTPASMIDTDASQLRLIYDFAQETSPLLLTNELQADLKEKGFEILFSCSREACGDVAGWRLYVSELMVGVAARQHYFIARRVVSATQTWYVTFYVNDISGTPRGALTMASTQPLDMNFFTINKALLSLTKPKATKAAASNNIDSNTDNNTDNNTDSNTNSNTEKNAFFAVNSAELLPAMIRELDAWGKSLVADPSLEISLEGYADSTGSDEHNKKLSQERADAVKNYLIDTYHIDAARLTAQGRGTSNVAPQGRDDEARRVDIFPQEN